MTAIEKSSKGGRKGSVNKTNPKYFHGLKNNLYNSVLNKENFIFSIF